MMRPLDRVGSIKLKLGIAIVVAVFVSAVVSTVGFRLGVPLLVRPFIAAAIALVLVQFLARGMTSPLREMADAARRMADGDWSQRVTASSADEVGQLGRAFNDMAAELAAVDRMRKDLVANVSHELRTPIAALQARLENIADGVDEPDPDVIDAMLSQTARLQRLVDQLLDLSRLESGAVPLHRQRVDVDELLDAVLAEARLHRRARPVRLTGTAGLTIDADPDRLHQVLFNLVINAFVHAPDGPVDVDRAVADDDLVLAVVDTGPGIAEPERSLERFHRADAARTAATGGAGLGLAIARWVVELHDGRIHVLEHEPSGSRVEVRLPRHGADRR